MARDAASDSFFNNTGGEKSSLSGQFPTIARGDFPGGVSAGTILGLIGTGIVPAPAFAADTGVADVVVMTADAANYPPVRTGLRGRYPGSFAVAHEVRDGRFDMLVTPFVASEKKARGQLQAMFGAGDPDVPKAKRPHVIGRQPWGRITIANADSAAASLTNAAIDMRYRGRAIAGGARPHMIV